MADITLYRELCSDENIIITKHCKNRCFVRNISLDDIEGAILSGEIIEDYPDDTLYIITAYFPDKDVWEDDFKTRKEQNI